MEMIETLVRGCKDTISDDLMIVFPMIANLTIMTDDSSIMQVVISLRPCNIYVCVCLSFLCQQGGLINMLLLYTSVFMHLMDAVSVIIYYDTRD